MATAYFDIVNSNIMVPYSSASNYDMVIRTEGIGQRLFIGNSNGVFVPGIVVSSNMVGIGKSNPAYALDVNGNVSLGSVASNAVGNVCAGNLGVGRNRVYNGDMRYPAGYISQTTQYNYITYPADGWSTSLMVATGSSINSLTSTRQTLTSSDTPFGCGFKNSARITVSSAVTISGNYWCIPSTTIPTTRLSDLGWYNGNSVARAATLSMWFRAGATGTYSISLMPPSGTYSYISSITVSTANSWGFYTINIPAPTTLGTSTYNANDPTQRATLYIGAVVGGNTGSAGWSTNGTAPEMLSGALDWPRTINNYIEFTGVQLESGSITTPFDFRISTIESLFNDNLVLGSVSANTVGNVCAGNLGIFRNRIINGDMRIDQRNNGAVVANATSYVVDRVQTTKVSACVVNSSRAAVTDLAGFRYAFKTQVATATATVSASDVVTVFNQSIEADNVSDLMMSSSYSQPFTVSFWLYSTIAHTFYLRLQGATGGSSRTYVSPVAASAGAWKYFSFTVPGDTAAGWVTSGNASGLNMIICTALGSSRVTSTANAWQTGDLWGLSSDNGFVNTLNAYTLVTGVQLEKGTLATPFEFRPYPIELILCQRYYQKLNLVNIGVALNAMDGYNSSVRLATQMRIAPSLDAGAVYEVNTGSAGTVGLRNILGFRNSVDMVCFYNTAGNWVGATTGIAVTCGLTAEL